MSTRRGDRRDVAVVGSVNADLVVRVPALPRPGETVAGGTFERHAGGKGANQAVAAARLGARTSLIAAVGDDDLGREQLELLSAEDVDVSGVTRGIAAQPTGVAAILVDDYGENLIAVASGANAALDPSHVGRALAPPPAVLVLSFEVPDEALVEAVAATRDAGTEVVINPAPARAIRTQLLDPHPILVLNEEEARQLGGTGDTGAAAAELYRRTHREVIVTLGPRGALVGGPEARAIPGHAVAVVDTTGAGDTFVGALAAELARGVELHEGVRYALAASALSVTARGARTGMPRRDAVDALLRESPPA